MANSVTPWDALAEKIIVAQPERTRVVIRAADGYRVAVENNPQRWEQALTDFEFIVQRVNSFELIRSTLAALVAADNCNYDRDTMRSEGLFDQARAALALAEGKQ